MKIGKCIPAFLLLFYLCDKKWHKREGRIGSTHDDLIMIWQKLCFVYFFLYKYKQTFCIKQRIWFFLCLLYTANFSGLPLITSSLWAKKRFAAHYIFIPHRLYTLELKRLKSFFKCVVFLDQEILALFVSSNFEKTSSLRQIPFTSISN